MAPNCPERLTGSAGRLASPAQSQRHAKHRPPWVDEHERVFARRQGGESHPPLLIRPLCLRFSDQRRRAHVTARLRINVTDLRMVQPSQRYRANKVPSRETGILLLRSSDRLHRVQIHVIGDCLAHPVADYDGARIVHAAPDPRVVAISACGRNAGVRPAGEIDAC